MITAEETLCITWFTYFFVHLWWNRCDSLIVLSCWREHTLCSMARSSTILPSTVTTSKWVLALCVLNLYAWNFPVELICYKLVFNLENWFSSTNASFHRLYLIPNRIHRIDGFVYSAALYCDRNSCNIIDNLSIMMYLLIVWNLENIGWNQAVTHSDMLLFWEWYSWVEWKEKQGTSKASIHGFVEHAWNTMCTNNSNILREREIRTTIHDKSYCKLM